MDNQFYFRAGYSNPSWSQFGMNRDSWGKETLKYGGVFEIGNIFMIQSIPSVKNTSFGLIVDYFYLNINSFTSMIYSDMQTLTLYRAGSKIGPSFSCIIKDKMAFDVYVKVDFAWTTEAHIEVNSDYYSTILFTYVGYKTFGLSSGLNFHYGLFIFGLEFNTIAPKLMRNGHSKNLDSIFKDSVKYPLPCSNFTIDICF